MTYPEKFAKIFIWTTDLRKKSVTIFRCRLLIQIVHHSIHITYLDNIFADMVKVKPVKAPKVVKAKAVAKTALAAAVAGDEIVCSPPLKKNGASKSGPSILSNDEQKSYRDWIAEIKQISGLIVCRLGLGIAEGPQIPQKIQEEQFVNNFEAMYNRLCKDVIIGQRVSKIPLKYLNIPHSQAIEIIGGEKMRKRYSTMKTYMNNVLSPLWRRYKFNVTEFI